MNQSNSIIEALFFRCYYAYLKGDLEDTSMFYALLKEEFRLEGSPRALSENQFRELARIKSALEGGAVSSKSWLTEPTPDTKEPTSSGISQKALVRKIYDEGTEDLRKLIQAKKGFYLYSIEHPCDQYGFVDMYYRDCETAFPIEIKVNQGDHRLLGQIMKYDLYCRFHLHEKNYFKVQAVTLCGSYDEYTLSELKRNGVIPILYKIGDRLTLSRL